MWNANDFCDAESGFDYVFSKMNAIYGATLTPILFARCGLTNAAAA